MTIPNLQAHQLRAVAVAASCDPRTVARYVRGEPISGLVGARIDTAIRDQGLVAVVRNPASHGVPQSLAVSNLPGSKA